jgi:hypothetical protein
MEKFSLYDLLGLLMPGILFVYFINLINSVFNIFSLSVQSDGWDISTLIFLCFSLIAGAMLYAVNFRLLKKPWYEWLFGMKKHVADIYNELSVPYDQMNQALNEKAKEWYGKAIFFGPNANHLLTHEERDLQDAFYDRMYYELEYLDKIDSAKTIQSFYYFFRQTVTASLLLLIVFFSFGTFCLLKGNSVPDCKASLIFWLPVLLVVTIALSVGHAQWYRKTMVLKMYWAYFTHLNQKPNN